MFYNVQITIKGVSHNVCNEKRSDMLTEKSFEIWHLFVTVLEAKMFHLAMDYMPVYGNKIPSEYDGIQLNFADNY